MHSVPSGDICMSVDDEAHEQPPDPQSTGTPSARKWASSSSIRQART